MRAERAASGFTTPRAVLEVGVIRDFDVAHRRDAILALTPAPLFTPATTSVILDWQSLLK